MNKEQIKSITQSIAFSMTIFILSMLIFTHINQLETITSLIYATISALAFFPIQIIFNYIYQKVTSE